MTYYGIFIKAGFSHLKSLEFAASADSMGTETVLVLWWLVLLLHWSPYNHRLHDCGFTGPGTCAGHTITTHFCTNVWFTHTHTFPTTYIHPNPCSYSDSSILHLEGVCVAQEKGDAEVWALSENMTMHNHNYI